MDLLSGSEEHKEFALDFAAIKPRKRVHIVEVQLIVLIDEPFSGIFQLLQSEISSLGVTDLFWCSHLLDSLYFIFYFFERLGQIFVTFLHFGHYFLLVFHFIPKAFFLRRHDSYLGVDRLNSTFLLTNLLFDQLTSIFITAGPSKLLQ